METKRKVCKSLQKGRGWTNDEHSFLVGNFYKLTNKELADHINSLRDASGKMTVSGVRHECKNLGLTRGLQIHWSASDISKLRAWYGIMGDKEIAGHLNENNNTFREVDGNRIYRRFTKKHVEKKRRLLGWSRTAEQLDRIKSDNLLVNTPEAIKKLWEKRGQAPELAVRVWGGRKFIKVNGRFTPYARWFYHNNVHKLGPMDIVFHVDGDTLNDDPANLAVIDRATVAINNSRNRYPKELREAQKTLKLLIKTINENEKQDQRFKRPSL